MSEIIYQIGLSKQFRSDATQLYHEAFGKKFSVAVRSEQKRLSLIQKGLVTE